MRSRFDEQLSILNKELLEMGALCEEAIAIVAQALVDGDENLASKAEPLEREIDRKERDIEMRCLRLLLQQQPVAKDLRQISAALKMITDMERIGDQAADIAEMIGYLKEHPIEETDTICQMAKAVTAMVTDSVTAFIKGDLTSIERVLTEDDVVDDLFDKVKHDLIDWIVVHPDDGEYAVDLLMVAKYFERIGDHAENLAEWVDFSLTGVHRGGERT